MRADRLLSILLLLQANRRMTAPDLASRLEVSTRTIHRDMDALSTSGVPVYAERGAGGGWVLPEEYRTNLTGLTEPEVRALFLATPARLLADLGLRQASEGVLVKLLAALPAAHRHDAEYARQRIHVDTASWRRPGEAAACLPVLQAAVWQERRLRIAYGRGEGEPVERLVDPLGLVAKGGIWYLIAAVNGEPRTYRAARVHAAEVLEEPCARPPDFDLATYWAASSAQFMRNLPSYPITVRVAPERLGRLDGWGSYVRIAHTGPTDADGWTRLELLAETEEDACGYALAFGARMEVLAPAALRERVARRAAEVVALYAVSRREDGIAARLPE